MPITSVSYAIGSTKFEWGAGFRAVNLFSKPHLFGSLTSFPAGAQSVLVSYGLSFLFVARGISMPDIITPAVSPRNNGLSLLQGNEVSLRITCVAEQHTGRCLEGFTDFHPSLRQDAARCFNIGCSENDYRGIFTQPPLAASV